MIQVLGKSSPAKRQFVLSLASLLARHYQKYKLYSENYVQEEEDYNDYLSLYPLGEYEGEEASIVESSQLAIGQQNIIWFLTPYQAEIHYLLDYIGQVPSDRVLVVYGEHIRESVLNKKYLMKRLKEETEVSRLDILEIEWDKLDKLIGNEGLFDGYYQLASLSGEYKKVLMTILADMENILPKVSKKYFGKERGLWR